MSSELKISDAKAEALVKKVRLQVDEGNTYFDACVAQDMMNSWYACQGIYERCVMRNGKPIYDPGKFVKIPPMNNMLGTRMSQFLSILLSTYVHGDQPLWTAKPTQIVDPYPEVKERALEEANQKILEVSGLQPTFDEFVKVIEEQKIIALERSKQIGNKRLNKHIKLMRDQQHEGGFDDAIMDVLEYIVKLGYGIFKGPVEGWLKTARWYGTRYAEGMAQGPVWSAPLPDRVRFSPDTDDKCNGTYVFEIMDWCRSDLNRLLEAKDGAVFDNGGFRKPAIKALLDEDPAKLKNWHTMFGQTSLSKGMNEFSQTYNGYPVIEHHVKMSGKEIVEDYGIRKSGRGKKIDKRDDYETTVYVCDKHLIGLCAGEYPLGQRPYAVVGIDRTPGVVYPTGFSRRGIDIQRVINALYDDLTKNSRFSSGPITFGNISRTAPGQGNVNCLTPYSHYALSSNFSGSSRAVEQVTVQNNLQFIVAALQQAKGDLDEALNMPGFQVGESPGGGLGRTARGFATAVNLQQKSQKGIFLNIDRKIFKRSLEMQFRRNMYRVNDPQIRYDADVVALGSEGLFSQDVLFASANEALANGYNLYAAGIIPPEGMRYLARRSYAARGDDPDRIIPPEKESDAIQAIVNRVQSGQALNPDPTQTLDGRSALPVSVNVNEPI